MKPIYAETAKRLKSLGVHYISDDDYTLIYSVDSSEARIKNKTNLNEVPDGLRYVWIDMSAGEYLKAQKAVGKLKICSADFLETPAKSITEGDVSITFMSSSDGVKTPESRLDELITKLTTPSDEEFARFRRFEW